MELIHTGYRMSEVGLIPEDWEVVEINDLFVFQGGSQPVRSTFIFEEKEGYVRLLQIRDYKSDKYASYIPTGLARRACIGEDIMIGRYGPPVFQILKGLEGAYNVALIKAIPTAKIIQQYGWYLLKQESLFEFIDKLSQRSSGQTGVDLVELKKYQLPLPPTIAEQTAIATALSDMDDLICGLERLIAKRRAIKEGAMQVLLTPKEGWSTMILDNVVDVLDNLRKPLNDFQRAQMKGDIPYCGANGIVDYVNDYLIDEEVILMAEDGGYFDEYETRPIAYRMQGKCWVNNHAHILRAKPNSDQDFVFYSLVHKNILDFINGGTRAKLNKGDLLNIQITLPLDKQEQAAIAKILIEMDAELAGLGEKLEKYRKIKEGMMQELLTGKIRLI
jgi:type I restriction enzyme S subunit